MSRWLQDFEEHPIHLLLVQADEYLAAEVEVADAAFEDERRRLKSVLGTLRAVVAGLDPEFYPRQWLDKINQGLNAKMLPELKAYFEKPEISYLQLANDYITAQAINIYQIAALARPPEASEEIKNAQKAFRLFASALETKSNQFEVTLSDFSKDLSDVARDAASLQGDFKGLAEAMVARYNEWQREHTKDQTTRAEEHSAAQIEREKAFAVALQEQQKRLAKDQSSFISRNKAEFSAAFVDFQGLVNEAQSEITEKKEHIRTLHGLVADETVAGGYHKSAREEGNAANVWRWVSIICLFCTAGWLAIKIYYGFAPLENGGVNWPDLITASSLTAILLYAAGYTSRQSKMHRDNETLLRSYALETQALDPFIASLAPSEQHAIKSELVRRMFGQQNAVSDVETKKIDEGTMKTLADKLADTVGDAVAKIVSKN